LIPLPYSQTEVDSHSPQSAQKHPKLAGRVAADLSTIINFLLKTSFDGKVSLMEQTQFVLGSEFTRTMKSNPYIAADQTGTDHNPFNNSFILGGQGIRGNQIIGESDWKTVDETLSVAHQQVDSSKIKLMGRPFDFMKQEVIRDLLPAKFDATQYLQIGNIINTIYHSHQKPKSIWRKVSTMPDAAELPIISSLLV
jgi:hypothetical protein